MEGEGLSATICILIPSGKCDACLSLRIIITWPFAFGLWPHSTSWQEHVAVAGLPHSIPEARRARGRGQGSNIPFKATLPCDVLSFY